MEKPYFKEMCAFIDSERKNGKIIYPKDENVLKAIELSDFEGVRVVILGQDPYHGPGQAMGLAFSVPDGVKIPPSLKNIFKEMKRDLGKSIPKSGNLTTWAEEGVLLLNTVLTVEKGKAGSHKGIGWEKFTNTIIKQLSDQRKGIVFVLWGRQAQEKEILIDTNKHFVLKSPHPSPFSAHKGFFGNGHFSKIRKLLGVGKNE